MTAAEHRKLPTLICIDVEPDARAPERGRQPDWGGFEQIAEQLRTIRPHLEDATGSPVHFSWFLRMDPQIALLHGAPGWVVGRYRTLLGELERAGDEIGLHIHPWRWDAQAETWVADFAGAEWGREAVRCGFDTFREQFGRTCRAIRFGDRWLTGGIVALASKMGTRFDLTPEPGVKPEPPSEAHNGLMPDYTPTPIVPYRPSFANPVTPVRGGIRRRPWMIPLTTVEFGPALRRVVDRLAATPLPPLMGEPIAGRIDAADCEWVAGWAYDAKSPDRAVTVVIYDDSEPVGLVSADEFRPDLKAAGVGDGRHGFSFILGNRLRDGTEHILKATVLGTTYSLPGGPVAIRCESRMQQKRRTLDLGQAFVGPVLDDVLEDPQGRRHIALAVRSSSAGDTVARAFDHLTSHRRVRELRVSTPQESITEFRVK